MDNNWLERFAVIPDPRTGNRKAHKLIDIITIAIIATLCGEDDWVGIEEFGLAREEWFRKFLELPHGIPSHDTFGRVFSLISPEAFEQAFLSWTQDICRLTEGTIIAIDGKTARRSHDQTNGQKPLHLVSAWASENGMVLAQRKVDEKSNEIVAIPKLLDDLMIKGCIVTIDAIGCQKEIVHKIREKQADYAIAVKGNQKTLHDDIRTFFNDAQSREFRDIPHTYAKTVEKGHGRVEIRRYWLSPASCALLPDHGWSDLNGVGMVEAERHLDGKVTVERRYYITSLTDNIHEFARAVRAHWGIENGLHWVLDMTFREDELRIRKRNAAQNAAILRRLALNLLKQDQSAKKSLCLKRKYCSWKDDYLLHVLSLANPNV